MVETVGCRLFTAVARPRDSMPGQSVLRFVMDKVTQAWVLLPFQVLWFLPVSTILQDVSIHLRPNAVTCVFGRTSGLSFANRKTKRCFSDMGKRMGKKSVSAEFYIFGCTKQMQNCHKL
jgi:hypothetical protein